MKVLASSQSEIGKSGIRGSKSRQLKKIITTTKAVNVTSVPESDDRHRLVFRQNVILDTICKLLYRQWVQIKFANSRKLRKYNKNTKHKANR